MNMMRMLLISRQAFGILLCVLLSGQTLARDPPVRCGKANVTFMHWLPNDRPAWVSAPKDNIKVMKVYPQMGAGTVYIGDEPRNESAEVIDRVTADTWWDVVRCLNGDPLSER